MEELHKSCEAVERDFKFWMPLNMVKGKEGEMRIGGIASDENGEDLQGEKVFMDGLEIDYLLERGIFNFNHGKTAGDILGEIDKAEKKDGKLYVEGFLYPHVEQALDIYNLMRSMRETGSKRRLGLSVEGKIKERFGNEIRKCWIKAVAITYNPINKNTYIDFIKSLEGFTFSKCTNNCLDCKGCSVVEAKPEEETKRYHSFAEIPLEGLSLVRSLSDPNEVKLIIKEKKDVEKADLHVGDGRASESESVEVCPKCGKPMRNGICEICNPVVLPINTVLDAEKALSAGHDVPAATGGVSGSAVREEDLDKKAKVTTYDERHLGLLTPKEEKNGKKTYTRKHVKDILARSYSEEVAEKITDLIFKAKEVKGFWRVRMGKREYVSPFTRRLIQHAKDTLKIPEDRMRLTGNEYFGMSKEEARKILEQHKEGLEGFVKESEAYATKKHEPTEAEWSHERKRINDMFAKAKGNSEKLEALVMGRMNKIALGSQKMYNYALALEDENLHTAAAEAFKLAEMSPASKPIKEEKKSNISILMSDFNPKLFKNSASARKAKESGFSDIEDEGLTAAGLIKKLEEIDESQHGVPKNDYERMKKQIEKEGLKVPDHIRVQDEDKEFEAYRQKLLAKEKKEGGVLKDKAGNIIQERTRMIETEKAFVIVDLYKARTKGAKDRVIL